MNPRLETFGVISYRPRKFSDRTGESTAVRASATKNPNLDALIPREDFEVLDEGGPDHALRDTIDIAALEKGQFFYESLRKPDFQRETANWPPDKVQEFVRTFLDGDLVPAVILWKSKGNTFVIDGAHRLSALIAWVNDDYGDGSVSVPFFGNRIAAEQKKIAEQTRSLVKATLGSYADYRAAAKNPDPSKPEIIARAKRLGSNSLKLQWVNGDAKKAEYSFFKINQSATLIDPTELAIIQARRKPNAMAARALMRAGTGHKYWSEFPEETQRQVEDVAREVHSTLFEPELTTPIKTLDLPVAGTGYSAETVKLIFDFINFANGVRPEMWAPQAPPSPRKAPTSGARLEDDTDGSVTLSYLRTVKRIAFRVSGLSPGSLGLHPAVYFYGATGRYQSAAFLACVALILELEHTDGFAAFTEARNRFEEFLVKYRHFINQTVNIHGSGTKSQGPIFRMYQGILAGIGAGSTDDQIVASLQAEQPRLTVVPEAETQRRRTFTSDTKSAAFLRDALEAALRCRVCGARVHSKSISIDHKTRKQDGGFGTVDNAQLTHPYCNTGYKEAQHAKQKEKA